MQSITFLENFINVNNDDSNYFATGQLKSAISSIAIEDIGTLPLPISDIVANAVIAKAKLAPFGKGMKTIVDTSVRNTWEIEPEKLSLDKKIWDANLKHVLKEIKTQMGIAHEIEVSLYKLLLYQEGSFFLKHQDTEKEKNMFGTLIIGLPSEYKGGELHISFDGENKVFDFSDNTTEFNWVAFYADCHHEVKKIIKGNRVVLVYNLIYKSVVKPSPVVKSLALHRLNEILDGIEKEAIVKPILINLKHQYTSENFAINKLKGDDKNIVELLLKATEGRPWMINVGLHSFYICGEGEYDHYNRNPEWTVDELEYIHDEEESFENWLLKPKLGDLSLENVIAINPKNIKNEEPIESEHEGYMGNYGPTAEFWYKFGVLVLIPPLAINTFVKSTNNKSKLSLISYYLNHQQNLKALNIYNALDLNSLRFRTDDVNPLFRLWSLNPEIIDTKSEFLHTINEGFLAAPIKDIQSFFKSISNEKCQLILNDLMKSKDENVLLKVVLLFHTNTNNKIFALESAEDHYQNICSLYLDMVYNKYNGDSAQYSNYNTTDFYQFSKLAFDLSFQNISLFIDKYAQTLNHTLFYDEGIKLIKTYKGSRRKELLNILKEYLIRHTSEAPMAPVDAKRNFPVLKKYSDYEKILKDFCEDPVLEVLEFRRPERVRNLMDRLIRDYNLDLDTEVISRGSPYTLKITKNTKSFTGLLKRYKRDMKTLKEFF
jgi:predicted 2-oxoglutarate/Fe(II)-dependent dioxygenase YbiX